MAEVLYGIGLACFLLAVWILKKMFSTTFSNIVDLMLFVVTAFLGIFMPFLAAQFDLANEFSVNCMVNVSTNTWYDVVQMGEKPGAPGYWMLAKEAGVTQPGKPHFLAVSALCARGGVEPGKIFRRLMVGPNTDECVWQDPVAVGPQCEKCQCHLEDQQPEMLYPGIECRPPYSQACP